MMKYKYSTLAVAIVALLSGCGAEDNKSLSDNNNNIKAPIVKGEVTIPALHVGMDAQGNYEYFDLNPTPRPEGNTIFQWRDVNDAPLGNEQILAITYPLLGEQVRFCVQPVAQGEINNVGDEICSEPRIVQEPLGEKPVANDVLIDDLTPTVNDTLTGSYVYDHSDIESEGRSEKVWKMGTTGNMVAIPDANASTLTLAPITEGNSVAFCVTPITDDIPVVRGDEVCSALTAPVDVLTGNAPVAENVAIAGEGFVGETFTGSYKFTDAQNDLQGDTKLVWERNGAPIADATAKTYIAVDADDGTDLTFCVTPIAATGSPTDGAEVCSAAKAITKKTEIAPVAANVAISVESGDLAEAGQVLVASYEYSQTNDAPEGDTLGHWTVGGVALDDCTVAQGCEYPLTSADIGKDISFSVTPKTSLGTPGAVANSGNTLVNGIKLSGVLEYDNTLTAEVFGYNGALASTGQWLVDSSNTDGPAGDLNRTLAASGVQYKIGTRAQGVDAPREVSYEKKVDGVVTVITADAGVLTVVDDYDWAIDDKTSGGTIADARNFVGKDVEFCLEVSGQDRCVLASDNDGVTGGLLFDASDASQRAIEPTRLVVAGTRTWHRPLTAAETTLAGTEFGELPASDTVTTMNGIDWALYYNNVDANKDQANAVLVCRNLYKNAGDWHLPIGTYDSRYPLQTVHGNNPPSEKSDPNTTAKGINESLITSFYDNTVLLSPTTGWPTGNGDAKGHKFTYASSSDGSAKAKGFYVTRFYAYVGGNTAVDKIIPSLGYLPNFVACIENKAAPVTAFNVN